MLPRARLVRTLIALIAPLGCASPLPPPPPPPPPPAASARIPLLASAAPPPARPSETTPITEDAPDKAARQLFLTRLAQPALRLEPTTTPPRVTGMALDDTRRGEAAGMKQAGPILAATLTEGQRATVPVKVPPGACVAFLAQGGLGVIEVDLFLTSGTGADIKILAQDPSTGPIAVLGGRGRCLGTDVIGTESVLHAEMRRGAGVVLVEELRQ